MFERFEPTSATEVITEFALALTAHGARGWEPVGTAIVIAPNLILTAKHVVEKIWGEHHLRRPNKQSDSSLLAFQVMPGTTGALWYAENAYFSPHTDLVLLDIFPFPTSALSYKWRNVSINFAPPKVGQAVHGFGYMGGYIQESKDHESFDWNTEARTTQGKIVAVHHAGRDRGRLNFPCIEMSARTEHGMSGGPLFDDQGRLIALVCGNGYASNGEAIWFGTLLWPLLLLEGIKARFQGDSECLFSFYDLVKRGVIAATGLDAFHIQEGQRGQLDIQLLRVS